MKNSLLFLPLIVMSGFACYGMELDTMHMVKATPQSVALDSFEKLNRQSPDHFACLSSDHRFLVIKNCVKGNSVGGCTYGEKSPSQFIVVDRNKNVFCPIEDGHCLCTPHSECAISSDGTWLINSNRCCDDAQEKYYWAITLYNTKTKEKRTYPTECLVQGEKPQFLDNERVMIPFHSAVQIRAIKDFAVLQELKNNLQPHYYNVPNIKNIICLPKKNIVIFSKLEKPQEEFDRVHGIYFWNILSNELKKKVETKDHVVLTMSDDENSLMSTGHLNDDWKGGTMTFGTAKVWDVTKDEIMLKAALRHDNRLSSGALSPSGTYAVTLKKNSFSDYYICLWDIPSKTVLRIYPKTIDFGTLSWASDNSSIIKFVYGSYNHNEILENKTAPMLADQSSDLKNIDTMASLIKDRMQITQRTS